MSIYAKEFVQDLGFFQQNRPIFPLVEGRLQQLTAYIETNLTAYYFGPEIENQTLRRSYDPNGFYQIFRDAFLAAYKKF